ncbi:LAFE_0G12112g1_1 [Lachancea fermentati]|uniref:THO complex subunit 2 n=1 Tax=Lachancea fermentati TaxID=4955 RepID=A0A1G4MID6_LACFM|nr:LAFE_0G12112g1_1 [Lachancea fermentati]
MTSLAAKINSLVKAEINLSSNRAVLNDSFLSDWESNCVKLVTEINGTEDYKTKKDKLQALFFDVLLLTSNAATDVSIDIRLMGSLIADVCASDRNRSAKLFISMVNSFPEKSDRLGSLLTSLTGMEDALCTYVSDDKLLERTGKFTSKQRSMFKKCLLESRYIIKKYNLLCEHSVGFSSLITMLIVAYCDPDKNSKCKFYWNQLQYIIGKYSLDPIRALDVILTVSSQYITHDHKFFISLLKKSDYWPHNIANALNADQLHVGGNITAAQVLVFHLKELNPSIEYFDMCCILIKSGFVSFMSIFVNLGPDDATITSFLNDYYHHLEAESMKGVSNPLAMAAALTDDTDENGDISKSNNDEDATKKVQESENDKTNEVPLNKPAQILSTGKMLLLERLLAHGLYHPLFFAYEKYPNLIFLSDNIVKLLARLFEFMIEPLYSKVVFNSGVYSDCGSAHESSVSRKICFHKYTTHDIFRHDEINTKFAFYYQEWCENLQIALTTGDLFSLSHEFLTMLGPHLGKCPNIITKLCRIGSSDLQKLNESEMLQKWIDFFRKFIFPALPLVERNVIVINEAFGLMKRFPFEKRYYLYNEMSSKLSEDNLFIKVAYNKAQREARSALKSLSIDNINQQAKKIARLISSNPLSTLIPTVNQIENYDKVSDLVVTTSAYFNDYAYDVLQYILLSKLSSGRQAVQSDGVNLMMWVQRLAVFVARLAKSSPKMDITNIIAYVIKTLHEGNVIAITILKEIILKVGGIKGLNDINTKLLLMLNAGKPLQIAARRVIQDTRDQNMSPSRKILDILIKSGSLSEVILLLYNLNKDVNVQATHYKILSTRCDEMSSILWSFIEMVKHFLSEQSFEANVLSFDRLINDYGVSTDWAFDIWRSHYEHQSYSSDDLTGSFDSVIARASFRNVDFNIIDRDLFLTFWRISLYDVFFELELYDEEKKHLESELQKASSNKERNEISKTVENLMASCIAHQKSYQKNRQILSDKTSRWTESLANDNVASFLQYCIIPRVLFSPSDALFTVYFIFEALGYENVLKILGMLVRSRILGTLLFCSTSSEASNLGLFFKTLLERIEVLRETQPFDNDSLRELYELHSVIDEDIIDLLSEKNYMSIRNGIEFMKHMSSVFPIVHAHISRLIKTIENNLINDDREDIRLPSNALLGHLKARMRDAIEIQDLFELNDEERRHHRLDEKQEITDFENSLAAEKKEAETKERLKREAEGRKPSEKEKQRAKEQIDLSLPSGPSRFGKTPALPMFEILNEMWDVIGCLERNHVLSLSRYIRNRKVLSELRNIEEENVNSLQAYRKKLAEVLEAYFKSLVTFEDHEKFKQGLESILVACKTVTNPYRTSSNTAHHHNRESSGSRRFELAYDEEPAAHTRDRYRNSEALNSKPAMKEANEGNGRDSRYGANQKNEKVSRYGARTNYKEKQRVEPSRGSDSASKNAELNSDHGSGQASFAVSSKGTEQKATSRYQPQTIHRGADNRASLSKSPIPTGPARARNTLENQTTRGAESRFVAGESRFKRSLSVARNGDRGKFSGSSSELGKRAREESNQEQISKRSKVDPEGPRNRYGPRATKRYDNPAAVANPDNRDRGKQNPSSYNKRNDSFKSKLPSGPKGDGNHSRFGN